MSNAWYLIWAILAFPEVWTMWNNNLANSLNGPVMKTDGKYFVSYFALATQESRAWAPFSSCWRKLQPRLNNIQVSFCSSWPLIPVPPFPFRGIWAQQPSSKVQRLFMYNSGWPWSSWSLSQHSQERSITFTKICTAVKPGDFEVRLPGLEATLLYPLVVVWSLEVTSSFCALIFIS